MAGHEGHRYLIDNAMQAAGADACVSVMSGDFTQRGLPAMNLNCRIEYALIAITMTVKKLFQRQQKLNIRCKVRDLSMRQVFFHVIMWKLEM